MTEWHLGKARHRSVGTKMETDTKNKHTQSRVMGLKIQEAHREKKYRQGQTKVLTPRQQG